MTNETQNEITPGPTLSEIIKLDDILLKINGHWPYQDNEYGRREQFAPITKEEWEVIHRQMVWMMGELTARRFSSEWVPIQYTHKKTKGRYWLIGNGLRESDLIQYAFYQSVETGQVWARPWTEFHDGRFERGWVK